MTKPKCRQCPDRRYDFHDLIAEMDLLKKKLTRAIKALIQNHDPLGDKLCGCCTEDEMMGLFIHLVFVVTLVFIAGAGIISAAFVSTAMILRIEFCRLQFYNSQDLALFQCISCLVF